MDTRDDFCAALDAQGLIPTDAIVILRNWDAGLTRQRINHAVDLMLSGYTPVLLMTYDANTYEEAKRVFNIVVKTRWKSITIVTHRSHHYRAYLTFLKVFAGMIEVRSSPVESKVDFHDGSEEFEKIKVYAARGHVATYEEGLRALE